MIGSFFFGVQLLSALIAVAVCVEYRRVCGRRAEFFSLLGDASNGKSLQAVLMALYVLTVFTLMLASYVFLSPF